MSKSVAQLLREAAEALERQTAPPAVTLASSAASSSSSNVTADVPTPPAPDRQPNRRAEVMRLFGPYPSTTTQLRRTPQASKKKKFTHTYTHRFFCLPGRKACEVPKPPARRHLESIGLGEKRITFSDRYCSSDCFAEELMKHFPLLKDCGGFQLLRCRGTTRSKELEMIPCPQEGYSPDYLMTGAAMVGQALVYVRPLQKDINIQELQETSSSSGPLIECLYCKGKFCLKDMEGHIDFCENNYGESQRIELRSEDSNNNISEESVSTANTTGESERTVERWSREMSSTSSHQPMEVEENKAEWKTEPDLHRAANMYRRDLLSKSENKPDLVVTLDLTNTEEEDREREILSFYKRQGVDWASPVTVKLKGDAALGDGVKQYFFSLGMEKVQHRFSLKLDAADKTLFFNGQDDHLVPSTARTLLDGDLFLVLGRIIGHSFLHGGPTFAGLSESLFPLISGHCEQTPIIVKEDCPDLDVVDVVSLLESNKELTELDRHAVNSLSLSWDLPHLDDSNRMWLAQTILHHGVIDRREKQSKQIRRGLKDTGVLPMLKERPELMEVLFPRSSSLVMTPEMILRRVIWPGADSDDEDADIDIEQSCKVTGFLREYIENASSEALKKLVMFWTGWQILPQHLYVEMSPSLLMPTASTCLSTLKLPLRCRTYDEFCKDIAGSLESIKYGFGLI